jgi:hypothetical protein
VRPALKAPAGLSDGDSDLRARHDRVRRVGSSGRNLRVDRCVGVRRRGHVRMAQRFLNDLHVHTRREHQGGRSMTKVVQSNHGQVSRPADAFELIRYPVRIEHRAVLVRVHLAGVNPGFAPCQALLVLTAATNSRHPS